MFRKTWDSAEAPVSDNAAFAGAPTTPTAPAKTTGRFGPTLNELQAADQKQLTPIPVTKPMSRRRSFVWKGRLLFWAVAVVFGVISASWKQIEKFAPGLNKTIHNSVTSQDDVDYHAAKLADARAQYDKATTRAPGQSLADFRKQFVTQGQAPLKAMQYEAAELQQALPHEHMTPECAPLVTDVFVKLQAYYRVEGMIMQAASTNDEAALDTAIQLEHTAVRENKAANAAVAAHPDCKEY